MTTTTKPNSTRQEEKQAIRDKYAQGNITIEQLAQEFNRSVDTIIRSIRGISRPILVVHVNILYFNADNFCQRTNHKFIRQPIQLTTLHATCILSPTNHKRNGYAVDHARVTNLPPGLSDIALGSLRKEIQDGLTEQGYHITHFRADVIMEEPVYD